MRISRSWRGPQISVKQHALEARRLQAARLLREGVSIRTIARQLSVSKRVSKSTVGRDAVVIRRIWTAQVEQLAKLWDSVQEHQERMQRVLEATWGKHAVGYTRLRTRLLHAMCERQSALEPPPPM